MSALVVTATATVLRPVAATDGLEPGTWSTVTESLRVQVSDLSTGAQTAPGGRQESDDARLYAAVGADVRRGDRVVVDGATWDVTWVQARRGLGLDHLSAGLRWSEGAT